jgi:hypothetical protein
VNRLAQQKENKLRSLYKALSLLVIAIFLRYLCHSIMLIPVLLNEKRSAPRVPDLFLDFLPQSDFLLRYNYWLWLVCYLSMAFYFFIKKRTLFMRFIVTDSFVSIARGLCIPLTTFGPPFGDDINAIGFDFWEVWFSMINPFNALAGGGALRYLTKDMFFSGHIATTFLIFLYARELGKRVGLLALVFNIFILLVVLFSHLHYAVDIIGAYSITFSIYIVSELYLSKSKKFKALTYYFA